MQAISRWTAAIRQPRSNGSNAPSAAALVQLREARHRQLVQNEKLAAVGELIAGVAHEINNPLAVMLGYVNLVTHELGPTAWSVRMEVDLILQQIARVQRIIDSLLYIARPKRDVAVLTPEDLSTLVQESLDSSSTRHSATP
ncbi:MAG: hypothetical protein HC834_08010 [Rhodospirillales bacterium]|nr:hypothetical protein [Rhodospirillales bacterium]